MSIYKEMFLNQFENKDTQTVYNRVFKKSMKMEKKCGIDLFDFNDEAYEELMLNELKPQTKDSARTYCNILSSYVQWGIENQFSRHNTNPIRRRQEYFYQFVSEKKLYFSFEEKESILFSLLNDQDKFLIQALFEGVQGNKLCELSNLEIKDVVMKEDAQLIDYEDYYINLIRKEKEIKFPISRQTYNLAIGANEEKEYYKKNGEVDMSNHSTKEISVLAKSKYVFKKINTNNNSENNISHYSLYNRLEMIKKLEEFQEFKDCLTTKNIVRSGMIYWAKKMYERDGELGRKQLEEVCDRYNIVYKWSYRDYMNLDIINELYYNE